MPSPHLSLRTMLSATSEELSELASKSATLELRLSNLVNKMVDTSAIADLQDLDYLSQSLEALSTLWATLAKDTPDSWKFSNSQATDGVLLRDLAAKLKGDHVDLVPGFTSGDCDLF